MRRRPKIAEPGRSGSRTGISGRLWRLRSCVQVIYRVVPSKDGTFAVQIDIPGTWPTTTVQTFLGEAEAEAWIERRSLR
jgi:hypothetical protein